MKEINPNKVARIKQLGKVDVSEIKQLVLNIEESNWDREVDYKANSNKQPKAPLGQTNHIIFQFSVPSNNGFSYFNLPLWEEWKPHLLPLMDVATKRYNYKEGFFSKRKKDEREIRSLFGINKGRVSMREALGMKPDTPTKEAIKKFWLLGEFLDLGTGVKNEKLDQDLKKRQKLLEAYKFQIANLRKKLQDDVDKEENEKSIE